MEAVKSMLREQDGELSDSSENLQGDQWDGIAEDTVVDHEDEYVDDDRFTTVTVEAVNVSRDGLHKVAGDDDESGASGTEGADEEPPGDRRPTGSQNGKRTWTEKPPNGPKKKKKKFKYESKAERNVTRYKERSGNREKAKARKK